MRRCRGPFVFFALLLFSLNISAQTTVFQQAPDPSPTQLAVADFASPTANQQAQRFSLTADVAVSGVVAWGSYRSGALPSDSFTVRFFADVGGFPATTPIAESSSLTTTRALADPPLNTVLATPIYKYTFTLDTPVDLTAATTYYFSITNNTSETERWNWVSSSGSSTRWNRSGNAGDANAWAQQSDFGLAFELTEAPTPSPDPTPVPTLPIPVLAFLAVIIMGLGVRRLRRR